MKNTARDAPKMRGNRSRNSSGELRQKRGDTLIGTIEKQYGINLHVRSDMHLRTYLRNHNLSSLSELVQKNQVGR